jgi:isopentenyl phosphate kinase
VRPRALHRFCYLRFVFSAFDALNVRLTSFIKAEAKACGCAHGGDYRTDARFRAGVDETRSKVRELNGLVVSALRERGIDAVGISPSLEGWKTRGVGVEDETSTSGRQSAVVDRARRGVVTVIHGDVVFDEKQGTSVLSGDDIVRWCARWVVDGGLVDSAERVRCVFLSDVFGVYDAAPTCSLLPRDDEDLTTPIGVAEEETATLIREIIVEDAPSESWTCVSAARLRNVAHPSRRIDADVPEPPRINLTLSSDVDDVTGGVATKLACAVSIARDVGATVYITRAGDVADERDASSTRTNHAFAIMSAPIDDASDDSPNMFLGTVVRRAARHRAIG